MSDEPEIRRGLVAPAVAAEHPGLWLAWTEVEAAPGPTPRELRERLRRMADRMHGAEAIAMRAARGPARLPRVLPPRRPRPRRRAHAGRGRWCCAGCREGGLRPQGLIADALTVAVLETGVGVWAFDGLASARRGSRRTAAGS